MRKEALPLNCMKCGREIALGQVFCKECLADMENYPIKPGTPVQLPAQDAAAAPRRPSDRRKVRKPEEQIALLRKWVLGLSLTLLAVILTFSIITSVLLHRIEQNRDDTLPGQNYSTVEDEASST
jgi:hypothetical protein